MKIPEKYRFIIELGKALHIYGIPSYKIQSYLTKVSRILGLNGSFMDLPTWINYVFYEEEEEQTYSYIECIAPGSLNLGALSHIVEITNKLIANEVDSAFVEKELKRIHSNTKKVNHLILSLAYATASAAFSLMIGTNWISFLFSFILGAVVYLIVFLSNRSDYLQSVLESLTSFIVTILCCILSLVFPQLNVGLTILSSIIIFIPGLAITTALEEITSKSLVSGVSKLFDALISLFKQFFGVLLGFSAMSYFIGFKLLKISTNIPAWIIFIAIPLFSISLLPIFQVRKKDMFFGVLTGISGFLITVMFSGAGILISTFLGTIGVVIISNIFSKVRKTSKIVFLNQGVIMLVPGSKSFMGLSSIFLNSNIVNASKVYEQVAFILMGIIGGLLFSGVFKNKERVINK